MTAEVIVDIVYDLIVFIRFDFCFNRCWCKYVDTRAFDFAISFNALMISISFGSLS